MKQKFKLAIVLCLAMASIFSSCKKEQDRVPGGQTQTEQVQTENKGSSIEELSDDYFRKHEDEKENADKLISVTKDFIALNGQTEEFLGKKPCKIQPIYSYGIDGVAYYEVWFTKDDNTVEGWILVSTTEKDLPLVNFSHARPYSANFRYDLQEGDKIYRFGVSYFVLERNGQKVADYGKMPSVLFTSGSENGGGGIDLNGELTTEGDSNGANLREGEDYQSINSYESLKQYFPESYFNGGRTDAAKSMRQDISARKADVANARVTDDYQYRWVSGPFCYYTQIPPNTGYNTFSCYSGCNNNAWACLYGWWDLNRGKSTLIPTTSTGEASPQYRNTAARQNSVDPVQMEIRSLAGTFCSGDQGSTYWSSMHKGYQYAKNKGYGYSTQWYYCWFSGCNSTLANIVTDGIANNGTPVIVGANSHMYLGYGWAQMPGNTRATWAYCYPAWSENHSDDVWIPWQDFKASTKMFVY